MSASYDPRRDSHPLEGALRQLGVLTLVGSRALYTCPAIATPESDWDFYLVPKQVEVPAGAPPWEVRDAPFRAAATALGALGFVRLPGVAGPYGEDQFVDGLWRLEPQSAFGRQWSNVDVIVVSEAEWARRSPVLRRINELGERGGLMCRGLKSEKAWGAFWWAHRVSS